MIDNITVAYNEAFVRRSHQLLAKGYKLARAEIDSSTEEEVISQFIYEHIDRFLNTPRVPVEFENFRVHNEFGVGNTGKTGRRRRKLDIMIDTDDFRPRPQFVFEAKRLKKGAFYMSDYVGVDGMQCFINEEYARLSPSAAMIGYMQSDDIDHWYAQLEDQFTGTARNALRIVKPLIPCNPNPIIQDIPEEWESEHTRLTKPPILIYHIFLDCS